MGRRERVVFDGQHRPLEEQALLLEIVRALVDDPARVRVVKFETDEGNYGFTIFVPYADMKNVLGAHGRTLATLQNLFLDIGARENRRVALRVRQLNTE